MIRRPVATLRTISVTVTAQRRHQHPHVVRKMRQDSLEGTQRVAETMQEHDRHAGARPLVEVGERHARSDLYPTELSLAQHGASLPVWLLASPSVRETTR